MEPISRSACSSYDVALVSRCVVAGLYTMPFLGSSKTWRSRGLPTPSVDFPDTPSQIRDSTRS
jgi:hypothetical protein